MITFNKNIRQSSPAKRWQSASASHSKLRRFSMHIGVVAGLFFATSLAAWSQPTQLDVASSRNHINKGNYLLTHQQFQAAIVEYQQAMAADPTNNVARDNIVLVHNNWGIQYFHQKKYDEARNEWNESLKLNPNDRNAKNNLFVLKTTLAKLPQSAPAADSIHAIPSVAESADAAIAENAKAKAGAEAGKEDNRALVILSTPSGQSKTGDAVTSNTDMAAMSTSTESTSMPPTAPPLANQAVTSTTSSATAPVSKSPITSTTQNNSIYNNAMNATAANSNPTFAPNPTQSAEATTPVNPPSITSSSATTTPSASVQSTTSSAPVPAPVAPTAPANVSPSFATSPTISLTTLESTLGQIEIKVYGVKKGDMPIIQRLEKLEQDTNSKISTGSIADRIQTLAKTYGI